MNLPKTFEKYISTRKDDESVAVKTLITIDLSGVTWEDILIYAMQAVIVKWQGWIRKQKGEIPAKFTYVLPKPGTKGGGISTREVKIQTFMEMGFDREKAERLADNPTLIRQALAGEL